MTDEELYQEVSQVDQWADQPREFTTAKEIARRNGLSRQAVRQKLEQMVDERDDVHRYKPSRDVIYWAD